MVSFLSFVTLALVGMAVASPLKRDLGVDQSSSAEKRDKVVCADNSQSRVISASLSEAKNLARIAADYISTHGTDDPLFRDYFGATDDATTPLRTFTDAASQNSLTLNCTDPSSRCGTDTTAYTMRSTNNIYYCPAFYNQVATSRLCSGKTVGSRSVRGGTTLHEVTRAVSGTTELRVGCSDSRKLASDHPDLASQNADNYSCFATQVYANTQCF